jgi:T-complex protein 1 subunit eta
MILADVFLQPGTDASQGKGQVLSNINACLAVQSTVKTTLGPYGGDLLLVDSSGKQTITNDGATVMKVLLLLTAVTGRSPLRSSHPC